MSEYAPPRVRKTIKPVLEVLAGIPTVVFGYFALLLVPVALASPRLGPLWLVPLALVLTPGSGHPTPFETSWTLLVAAAVIGLSLRASEPSGARRSLENSPTVGVSR